MQLSILIAVVMGLSLAAYDFFANAPIAGATGAVRLIGSIIRVLAHSSCRAKFKRGES